eukprot:CAMPEP_0203965998 /NCGR_PEP_ID=MMETSP0359-20131031/95353_1 /ASSEMBLY_ACC=CAM_ASM_000338 /TAXON_ID=268821 /ORGANISM="Scrippsiella Hangoei, Strain SHTV-5" /LENGTH=30 /DNA_ID= /DNA_START= /DNA_END= /DNA_ORIENTATION=
MKAVPPSNQCCGLNCCVVGSVPRDCAAATV